MTQLQKIIDISWPINPSSTTYKNNKPIIFSHEKQFEKDGVRDSHIAFNVHTGTHVDAPAHFLKNGIPINNIPLDHLVGSCRIIDLTTVNEKITADDLIPHNIQADEIILLKTNNSNLDPYSQFNYNFIYLDKTGARYLADSGIKTVGIDYLGIEREQPNHETHCILFTHHITIIEGLRLAGVTQSKTYMLSCLPLALHGLEAAPARAVLIESL